MLKLTQEEMEQMEKQEGMEEVGSSAEIIALEVGEGVTGVYKNSEVKNIRNKDMIVHYLEAQGEVFGVWGSTDMNKKLMGLEGRSVVINYKEERLYKEGEEDKKFKVFKVSALS